MVWVWERKAMVRWWKETLVTLLFLFLLPALAILARNHLLLWNYPTLHATFFTFSQLVILFIMNFNMDDKFVFTPISEVPLLVSLYTVFVLTGSVLICCHDVCFSLLFSKTSPFLCIFFGFQPGSSLPLVVIRQLLITSAEEATWSEVVGVAAALFCSRRPVCFQTLYFSHSLCSFLFIFSLSLRPFLTLRIIFL